MSLILNIETTTTNCSVSLGQSGKLIGLKEDNGLNYSHGESLHIFIEELLNKVGCKLQDLDAVAVSEGPGSYTGLRIGVSAAKGFCYALDIPLIATSTLKALALQVKINTGYIISMLDARRMEVYAEIFDNQYATINKVEPVVIDSNSFSEILTSNLVYFNGNSNEKVKELISHKNAHFLDYALPSSREMITLSFEKFQNKSFEDLAYFEPRYLKEFVALKKKG